MDAIPVQSAQPSTDTSRFRTIEAYAGFHVGDLDVSVGKQALWWGPTYNAPLSFSTNAEPTKNLKVSTSHPVHLWLLGEVRAEFVMGKLGGQMYTWRPWFNALKISFKLTKDLEMGFTRWSIFWGVGHPITAGSFLREFPPPTAPRDRARASRTPGTRATARAASTSATACRACRTWLTVYADSYCEDDPSPLANPRRAAINPASSSPACRGRTAARFRVEAPSLTPMDAAWDLGGDFNYFNNQYRSGNTNYGDARWAVGWAVTPARRKAGWAIRFRPARESNSAPGT